MYTNQFQNQAIAILRNIDDSQLTPVVQGLHESGIRFLEIAANANNSEEENARRIVNVVNLNLPGLHVGAGTVTTPEYVRAAAEAGAEFILSPDTIASVIGMTKKIGLISIPGAFSPTEVRHAYEQGADIIKIFPAATLGPSYCKDLLAPMPGIPFCAVGGVNEKNALDFIRGGAMCVGIGSALFPKAPNGGIDLAAMRERASALVAELQSA